MKKIILAIFCFSGVSLASASSLLSLSPYPSDVVLGTIKLNHAGSTSAFYKIDLHFIISDGVYQTTSHSTMKGGYSNYSNKSYIVDKQSETNIKNIIAVKANLIIQTCTDNSFTSCAIVKQQDLNIDYSGDLITSIAPNSFDVTI